MTNACTISNFEKNAIYDDMGYEFKMKFEGKRNRKNCLIRLGKKSKWQIDIWADPRPDLENSSWLSGKVQKQYSLDAQPTLEEFKNMLFNYAPNNEVLEKIYADYYA